MPETMKSANARRACMCCGESGALLLRLEDGRNVRACAPCLRGSWVQEWARGTEREPIYSEADYKAE